MAKHKSIDYRRDQRNRHINKKKEIIRSTRFYSFSSPETNEDIFMPVSGKLDKGRIQDYMENFSSCNSYSVQERKKAASMMEQLRDLDGEYPEAIRRAQPDLSRVKNGTRKISGGTYYGFLAITDFGKGTFSHDEFQALLA